MSYDVCVHFSLPTNYLLCIGALSIHVWSMALISRGVQLSQFHQTEWSLKLLVSLTLLLQLTVLIPKVIDAMLHLYLFYHYFHADCSSELVNCMPLPLQRHRCTRLSTFSHTYSVHLSNATVDQYFHSFIPYTGKLWNSLPLSVFPHTSSF